MSRILRCKRLPERARWRYLALLGLFSGSRKKVIFGLHPGPLRVRGGVGIWMGLIPYNRDIQSYNYKGPFINYGSGGAGRKLGGPRNKITTRRGAS